MQELDIQPNLVFLKETTEVLLVMQLATAEQYIIIAHHLVD